MTTNARPRAAPEVGDRAPFSYGMTGDKAFYSFESQAGRTAVLILAGRLAPSALTPLLSEFERRAADFARCEADVVALIDSQSPHVQAFVAEPPRGMQAVYCLPEIFYGWGFDHSEPSVVVIDRNARVIAPIARGEAAAMAEAALACAASAPAEPPRDALLPAPVLLIPNIFSADFCRTLIDHFESGAKTVGGMASIDAKGNAIHKIDEAKKRRADCVIAPDDPLCGAGDRRAVAGLRAGDEEGVPVRRLPYRPCADRPLRRHRRIFPPPSRQQFAGGGVPAVRAFRQSEFGRIRRRPSAVSRIQFAPLQARARRGRDFFIVLAARGDAGHQRAAATCC